RRITALPGDRVVGREVRGQRELLALDLRVRLVAVVRDRDDAVRHGHRAHILALRVVRVGRHTSRRTVRGGRGGVRERFRDGRLGSAGEAQTFRDLRADQVVLIRGNGDGRQNADDRDDDHQLNEGETLLHTLLHRYLLVLNSAGRKTASRVQKAN